VEDHHGHCQRSGWTLARPRYCNKGSTGYMHHTQKEFSVPGKEVKQSETYEDSRHEELCQG